MEKNLFCEEIKPIFYKTDIERNKNWETLLPSSNFFRTQFSWLMLQTEFQEYLLSDKIAKKLKNPESLNLNFEEIQTLLSINNYTYELIYGEAAVVSFREVEKRLESNFGEIDFSNLHQCNVVLSFICEAYGSLNEPYVAKARLKNSKKNRRLLAKLEEEINSLKNHFFLEEIQRVFSARKKPVELSLVLQALCFIYKEEEVGLEKLQFSVQDLSGCLMTLKPWNLNKFKRAEIRKRFLRRQEWNLQRVSKQSKEGYIMGNWVEAILKAGDLIENIKSPCKLFFLENYQEFWYMTFPGDVTLGIVKMDSGGLYMDNEKPYNGAIESYSAQIKGKVEELNLQGFRKVYKFPKKLTLILSKQNF